MRHPTEGVLRRLLDEPAGVSDVDRLHVADCHECLDALVAVRDDADACRAALPATTTDDLDLAAAWQRVSAPTAAPAEHAAAPRSGRLRAALRRPAAAAVAVTLVLAGAGTAAANDWLPIFRAERVAPLSLSTGDLLALPDLSDYGDLEVEGEPDVRSLPDAAAVESITGLEAPRVTALPLGVTGEPVYQVVGEVSATFTFSAERAARAAAEQGEPLPPPPPGLDGSAVRLDAGPGLAQVWTSSSGAPALVVGRATAPTGFSSGVPFEDVRDYLLSLPGLPDDLQRQLSAFAADGSTLPIPVPSQLASTSTAQVDGVEATVLESRDRSLAAVVWVRDGVVTLVGGALDTEELLGVARDLG